MALVTKDLLKFYSIPVVCQGPFKRKMAELKRHEKDETVSSPAKKIKLDVKDEDDQGKTIDVIDNWHNFEVKRVLNNNIVRKQIWLEGTFKGHESTAIVLLEKKIFPDESESLKNFFDDETLLKHVFDNDAYGTYECFPIREYNGEFLFFCC